MLARAKQSCVTCLNSRKFIISKTSETRWNSFKVKYNMFSVPKNSDFPKFVKIRLDLRFPGFEGMRTKRFLYIQARTYFYSIKICTVLGTEPIFIKILWFFSNCKFCLQHCSEISRVWIRMPLKNRCYAFRQKLKNECIRDKNMGSWPKIRLK